MKIAYVLYPNVIISNKSNGIRSQAETWATFLQERGHQVDLVNNWGNYEWDTYDIIHFFGKGNWIYDIVSKISNKNVNLIYSPIYDYSAFSLWGFIRTSLYNMFCLSKFRHSLKYFRVILVRTDAEKRMVKKVALFSKNKIEVVPISYSEQFEHKEVRIEKENFCFHLSSICQSRKNVIRLIEAAQKYGFTLYLAGNKGSVKQYRRIKEKIGTSDNIHVLGFISEEEKYDLYNRAKVFALPSLREGVGIVALDAALLGCEIVITDIPGPKEYFNNMAHTVNPYDVDDIGRAISDCINGDFHMQPMLSKFIRDSYSKNNIVCMLEKVYDRYRKV